MTWRDEGILLAVRRHGEGGAIIEVLTRAHGRAAGLVRGGGSRKMAPVLQPGAQLDVTWSARLEAHLGNFVVEPQRSRMAGVLSDRRALAGLSAVVALSALALPEREDVGALYDVTEALLDVMPVTEAWPLAYLRWEVQILEHLGYGLDLTRCAVTGRTDGLAYVSPRTGRAVTVEGAGEHADRLLPMPSCLRGGDGSDADVVAGLDTTGHFLQRDVLGERPLPEARRRLVELLGRG
ncbi:MAG: DNA repair protein RecO [Shimia sp.]